MDSFPEWHQQLAQSPGQMVVVVLDTGVWSITGSDFGRIPVGKVRLRGRRDILGWPKL